MQIHRPQLVAVSVICLLLAGSGCAHHTVAPATVITRAADDYIVAIRKTIKDHDHADKLVAITEAEKQILLDTDEKTASLRARMKVLVADYDAPPAQFRRLLDEENAFNASNQVTLLGLRAEAASLTTDEEWKQLAKFRSQAITAFQSVHED